MAYNKEIIVALYVFDRSFMMDYHSDCVGSTWLAGVIGILTKNTAGYTSFQHLARASINNNNTI